MEEEIASVACPTGVEDRFRGALIGLAVGDALGTTLKFKTPENSISNGICFSKLAMVAALAAACCGCSHFRLPEYQTYEPPFPQGSSLADPFFKSGHSGSIPNQQMR